MGLSKYCPFLSPLQAAKDLLFSKHLELPPVPLHAPLPVEKERGTVLSHGNMKEHRVELKEASSLPCQRVNSLSLSALFLPIDLFLQEAHTNKDD